MAYGFKVTGVDGNYQVDTDNQSGVFLAVKEDGSKSAGQSVSNYTLGDILYAGFDSSTGSATKDVLVSFNSSGVNPTFISGGDFVLLRPTNTHTAAASIPGDYGIQVRNASNTVCFDSRLIAKGMEIIGVKATLSIAGGYPNVLSWNTDTNNIIYQGADLKDIYITTAGASNQAIIASGTPTVSSTGNLMGFRYIYDANGTSGKIKLINAIVSTFGPYARAFTGIPNFEQLIIGKFIQ